MMVDVVDILRAFDSRAAGPRPPTLVVNAPERRVHVRIVGVEPVAETAADQIACDVTGEAPFIT